MIGLKHQHRINLAFLLLLFLFTLSNARPHEGNTEILQERSVNQRVKLAKDAKYHLNGLQGARQFCINLLKSDPTKTSTVTAKAQTTTTTTSTITPQPSTVSTTVFASVTSTISSTIYSTPSTTVSVTVPGLTTTTVVIPTVTQTVTTITTTTTTMMSRRSSNKSPLFSFSHEIIKDACLLFLYGSLQPPPGSTVTRTSTSTITNTVKTTAATPIISTSVTSTSSFTITETISTNAPTSTITSTITAAPSTLTLSAPAITTTVTETIPPPRFEIISDQGQFYIQDGGNQLRLSSSRAQVFNIQHGQASSAFTSGNLFLDGTNLDAYAINDEDGLLTFFPFGSTYDYLTTITCRLNPDQTFQCSDDQNLGYNTFYACTRVYLYTPGGVPPDCSGFDGQQLTNVKYRLV